MSKVLAKSLFCGVADMLDKGENVKWSGLLLCEVWCDDVDDEDDNNDDDISKFSFFLCLSSNTFLFHEIQIHSEPKPSSSSQQQLI